MPGLVAIPVVVLIAGTLALLLLNRAAGPRNRSPLTLLIIGVAFLALLTLTRDLPAHTTISRWRPFFESDLAYHVDRLAFLFATLMTLVALATVITCLGRSEGSSYAALLALLAAGLSFVFSANLITLCLSWVIFDLTLLWALARLQIAPRVPRILNLSWLACLSLLAAALLLGADSLSPRSGPISAPVVGLVLLAALIRVGLYPLHLWMPIGVEAGLSARSLLHLVPASVGLYLLTRLSAWDSSGLPYGPALTIAGGLASLIGALLAWVETDRSKSLSFIMISQVGYAVASLAVAQPPTMVAWPSLNLVLCLGLLFLSQDRSELGGLWAKAASGLAMASLAGVPLTLGFVGRWYLYHSLLIGSRLALLVPTLLAETFLFAALLRMWVVVSIRVFPPEFAYRKASVVGAALLAVPILVLGLHPPVLGYLMKTVSFPTLTSLLCSTSFSQWMALFLPLLGSYLLQRYRQRIFDPLEAFWPWLSKALRLEWLYGLLGQIADGAAGALWIVGRVSEGRGYLGWVVVVGLLVLLFLWGRIV
jgi:formate hydrogenlyase subunit 3/multisubunit Na+/H+ antiporter MnhD subunit